MPKLRACLKSRCRWVPRPRAAVLNTAGRMKARPTRGRGTLLKHALKNRVPSYRRRKASGQAIVTLNSQDCYLGPYADSESREKYNRLIAEKLSTGGISPSTSSSSSLSRIMQNEPQRHEGTEQVMMKQLVNSLDLLAPWRSKNTLSLGAAFIYCRKPFIYKYFSVSLCLGGE